jgi:hypothetical protein
MIILFNKEVGDRELLWEKKVQFNVRAMYSLTNIGLLPT